MCSEITLRGKGTESIVKLKTHEMSYERWCRANGVDAGDLDANFENYLIWTWSGKDERLETASSVFDR